MPRQADDFDLKREFDPEPLLAFIARRAKEHPTVTSAMWATTGRGWLIQQFGDTANLTRQFDRWRAGATLSWWYADKIAGMLKVHPAWIWPDWYDGVPSVEQLATEQAVAA